MNRARERKTWKGSAAVALIYIAGATLLIKGLYPVDLPSTKDPAFIDSIFHNRAVIWAARLLLMAAVAVLAFGGLFIVISIGMRMKNRKWLRRAGPFEISEATLAEMTSQRDHWRVTALLEHEKVVELTECLEESDELITQLRTAFTSGSIVGEEHA